MTLDAACFQARSILVEPLRGSDRVQSAARQIQQRDAASRLTLPAFVTADSSIGNLLLFILEGTINEAGQTSLQNDFSSLFKVRHDEGRGSVYACCNCA
jgi:hypothetical protein